MIAGEPRKQIDLNGMILLYAKDTADLGLGM